MERPLIPLDRIVAVLNMDMIGRNEEVLEGGGPRFRGLAIQSAESNRNAVNLLGQSYSPSLARTIEQANAPFGLTLKEDLDNNASNLLRRSDHWPFLQPGFRPSSFTPDCTPTTTLPPTAPKGSSTPRWSASSLVHQAS